MKNLECIIYSVNIGPFLCLRELWGRQVGLVGFFKNSLLKFFKEL